MRSYIFQTIFFDNENNYLFFHYNENKELAIDHAETIANDKNLKHRETKTIATSDEAGRINKQLVEYYNFKDAVSWLSIPHEAGNIIKL